MTVFFQNAGLIDLRAVKTFGVSSKDAKNPIGEFGTGLKYAVAILLREKQTISLWQGKAEYKFTLKKTRIRNDDFQIVCMNGEELAFTTRLGKNWELWQAYRELYSNCIDEDGTITSGSPDDRPIGHGDTCVEVSGSKFQKVYQNRNEIILSTKPILMLEGVEVHEGQGEYIFYRDIRTAIVSPNKALYNYNISSKMRLTEDRTFLYGFQVGATLAKAITQAQDKNFLEQVLTAKEDSVESDLDFTGCLRPSDTFIKVVEDLVVDKLVDINITALNLCKRYSNLIRPKAVELTKIEAKRLTTAKEVCVALGCKINKYPIVITDGLGTSILGLAENNTIYISKKCFQLGNKMLASTIYEEYIHLYKGYGDMTRSLQNFLFDKILDLVEEYVIKDVI